MNIIAIKGRLVKDPELRLTQSGISTCTITVAVDRYYKKDGEQTADFFDCVFWRQGADFISKYFTKGKEIIVHGEMQSRKYQDKEGNNRIVWEIQNCKAEFCGSKSELGNNTHVVNKQQYSEPQFPDFQDIGDITDGDLPF